MQSNATALPCLESNATQQSLRVCFLGGAVVSRHRWLTTGSAADTYNPTPLASTPPGLDGNRNPRARKQMLVALLVYADCDVDIPVHELCWYTTRYGTTTIRISCLVSTTFQGRPHHRSVLVMSRKKFAAPPLPETHLVRQTAVRYAACSRLISRAYIHTYIHNP